MNLRKKYPYWYFERLTAYRQNTQMVLQSQSGTMQIPINDVGFIMFGPGVRLTSNLLSHLSRSGGHVVISSSSAHPTAICSARNLYGSGKVAAAQAKVWAGGRLAASKRLASLKFPEHKTKIQKAKTIRTLFGIEGPEMKKTYQKVFGKSFRRVHQEALDQRNHNLNILYNTLYNTVYVFLYELGLSAHLGLIHGEKRWSFVFDLADVYKTEPLIRLALIEDKKEMLLALSDYLDDIGIYKILLGAVQHVFNLDKDWLEIFSFEMDDNGKCPFNEGCEWGGAEIEE